MNNTELLPCPFWWADNEEGPYHGPFNTEDAAISDAYSYSALCFDDPSQQDGFWLLNGKLYKNQEYDPEFHEDYGDCAPYHITGEPKYTLMVSVTDKFHEAWNTRADKAALVERIKESIIEACGFYGATDAEKIAARAYLKLQGGE